MEARTQPNLIYHNQFTISEKLVSMEVPPYQRGNQYRGGCFISEKLVSMEADLKSYLSSKPRKGFQKN